MCEAYSQRNTEHVKMGWVGLVFSPGTDLLATVLDFTDECKILIFLMIQGIVSIKFSFLLFPLFQASSVCIY